MESRVADRRVQRTQEALRLAFRELLAEQGFAATTIQDITERANVNRGTFYIHFADKYALADSMMREAFKRQLVVLPDTAAWDRVTMYSLIQIVLVSLEGKYHHQVLPPRHLAEITQLLERAMRTELSGLMLAWLKQSKGNVTSNDVPLETIAQVVSAAIYGSALHWSQTPMLYPAAEMAEQILVVIMDGVGRLAPMGA